MDRFGARKGFTIIELLVVVSIIALLIGILLPAIGKAREGALLTKSQAQIRQLGTSHTTYAGEWNDRHITFAVDNIATYGNNANAAVTAWNQAHVGGSSAQSSTHPPIILGWGENGTLWGYWMDHPGNHPLIQPIDFGSGFGAWRLHNAQQFNRYMSGRFYDSIWYAPKDKVVLAAAEDALEHPAEYCSSDPTTGCGGPYWSSYVMSPAAMYSPSVLSVNSGGTYYTNPWSMPAGLRCPTMSQALYPDLKTHVIEHHWLQNTRADCNPGYGTNGDYEGCQPYYFNAAWESAPVTLFFDGHIETIGTRQAEQADRRSLNQSGVPLWSRHTPLGPNGYYSDLAYDWTTTSFHVLTVDGIRGRDIDSN